jgi:ABC-type dipeptide/oligopeptide/nickel transport system permease component
MGLGAFVLRRGLLTIPVFFGVTFLTFVISHVVVPDPVLAWAGEKSSPQTIAAIAAQYHLKDPLYLQYFYYMSGLFRGDWGISPVTHLPVLQQIETYFPATVELSVAALIISVIIGIPVGVLSALWSGRKLDYPIRVLYLTGVASPPFLLALAFQLLFSFYFKLLPSAGQLSPLLAPPTHITGMYIVDSLLTGNWPDLVSSVRHIILPAFALALLTFSIITRITRSSMLETIGKDFVRTAKAKGLPKRTVTYRHTLRNALTSTVTVIGFAVQLLLSGTIVVETIFFWPGIGYYTTQSILSLDFPSIMGVTVVFTLVVIVTNLVTDLAYGIIDPRVRYE